MLIIEGKSNYAPAISRNLANQRGFLTIVIVLDRAYNEVMVMANIETNEMFTTSEAAEFLGDGTRPSLLQKHCQRKVIKGIKLGKQWLISMNELIAFKENRRPPGRPAT